MLLSYIPNIYNEYSEYAKICRLMKRHQLSNTNSYRILDIINKINYKTITTYSQYPLLFLSSVIYKPTLPAYIEDLSASSNLGRPDIWKASLKKLELNPADIAVDKTTNAFLSRWTELGKLMVSKYITIAYFNKGINNGVIFPYKDRISISKKFFKNNFLKKESLKNFTNSQYYNRYNRPTIIKVSSKNKKCIESLTLKSFHSIIKYDFNLYNDFKLYSFVFPRSKIELINSKNNCNYDIDVYEQKNEK